MSIYPRKGTLIGVALTGVVLTVSLLAIPWARWREDNVYQALRENTAPAFWWPAGWRESLRSSFLLEGEVRLRVRETPASAGEDRQQSGSPGCSVHHFDRRIGESASGVSDDR